MALSTKRKVMAYITHGNRLLVFRQPDHPEAGIQVPGGSVHDDEPLDAAVLREAFEETGLDGLTLVRFLGESRHDWSPHGRQEVHQRHYYHLTLAGNVPETWQHVERDPSEGDYDSVLFEFSWAELPDGVPPLIAWMDEKLPELLQSIWNCYVD